MVLNGKMINPGELRTQIGLGTRGVSVETGGFQVGMMNFTQFAAVWARWQNVHGPEVWAADAQNAVQPATVLIRYRSDVDPTCGVRRLSTTGEGGDWYEIVSMDNIQERNEFIELKVKRVVSG